MQSSPSFCGMQPRVMPMGYGFSCFNQGPMIEQGDEETSNVSNRSAYDMSHDHGVAWGVAIPGTVSVPARANNQAYAYGPMGLSYDPANSCVYENTNAVRAVPVDDQQGAAFFPRQWSIVYPPTQIWLERPIIGPPGAFTPNDAQLYNSWPSAYHAAHCTHSGYGYPPQYGIGFVNGSGSAAVPPAASAYPFPVPSGSSGSPARDGTPTPPSARCVSHSPQSIEATKSQQVKTANEDAPSVAAPMNANFVDLTDCDDPQVELAKAGENCAPNSSGVHDDHLDANFGMAYMNNEDALSIAKFMFDDIEEGVLVDFETKVSKSFFKGQVAVTPNEPTNCKRVSVEPLDDEVAGNETQQIGAIEDKQAESFVANNNNDHQDEKERRLERWMRLFDERPYYPSQADIDLFRKSAQYLQNPDYYEADLEVKRQRTYNWIAEVLNAIVE